MFIKSKDYIVPIASFFYFLAYGFIMPPLIDNHGGGEGDLILT